MSRSPVLLALVALTVPGCLSEDGPGGGGGGGVSPPDPPPPGEAWTVTSCAFGAAPRDARVPDVLVARAPHGADGATRLLRVAFESGAWTTTARSDAGLADPEYPVIGHAVLPLGDFVYVAGARGSDPAPGVLKLDRDLRVVARVDAERVGSLVGVPGRVFVAGTNLTAHDGDLREISRLPLPLKWEGKMVHDGILHDGTAYLLDDVVMPLFALRVDVRNPARMEVLERLDLQGGSLPGHWLDPEDGDWIILNSWGGRSGGYLNAHAFPMRGGPESATVRLHVATWDPVDGGARSESGHRVTATTGVSPVWAFVEDAAGARFGRLDLDAADGRVRFCAYDLPAPLRLGEAGAKRGLHQGGDHVVGHWGSTIFVIDASADPPRLLASASLDEPVSAVRVAG